MAEESSINHKDQILQQQSQWENDDARYQRDIERAYLFDNFFYKYQFDKYSISDKYFHDLKSSSKDDVQKLSC